MKKLLAILVLLLFFSTTALTLDAKPNKASRLQERKEFVTQFAGEAKNSVPFMHSYDFEPVGEHTLLLWESMNRAYLVEVDNFCRDLPWAMAIGIDNRSPTLNAKFDSIIVRGQRCRIMEIRTVDVKAMKAAQKANREVKK